MLDNARRSVHHCPNVVNSKIRPMAGRVCDGSGVVKSGPRFRPMPFAEMPPFEQRIRVLCEAVGCGLAELGTGAGLSRETVPRWIDQARKGAPLPGKRDAHGVLAAHYGCPVEWLVEPTRLPAGTVAPSGVKAPAAAPGPNGQLAAVYEAVGLLQRRDGLTREKAWALMLDLNPSPPTALAFYEAAWRRLEKKG